MSIKRLTIKGLRGFSAKTNIHLFFQVKEIFRLLLVMAEHKIAKIIKGI